MHVCKKCGTKSQRGGKCWDKYGTCIKCAKIYYNTLKCKRCSNTSNHTTAKCWTLYGICGECYRKEFFTHKKGQYNICKICGEYLVRAFTNKQGTHIKLPYVVCTKCRIIYVMNHNYKVEPLE